MRKKQNCTECGKPSIPGLKPGHGKCQYHWNVGAFGKAWADKCVADLRAFREAFDERVRNNPK